jgi:hypothetical protein
MILIFFVAFLKHKKDAFFYMKICLENFLGSSRMDDNKIFFLFFFKGDINLKVYRFFLNFKILFKKCFGENQIF